MDDQCSVLERKRASSLRQRDQEGLQIAAGHYVDTCRSTRSRIEVALAMAELAGVLRNSQQYAAARAQAQACINFEYLAVGCHVEKALALNELGMQSEAKQILRTAAEVLPRLDRANEHKLEVVESGRSKITAEEYDRRARQANAHLRIAGRWAGFLRAAAKYLGADGRTQGH